MVDSYSCASRHATERQFNTTALRGSMGQILQYAAEEGLSDHTEVALL